MQTKRGPELQASFRIDWPPHGVTYEVTEDASRIVSTLRSSYSVVAALFFLAWMSMTASILWFGVIGNSHFDLFRLFLVCLLLLATIPLGYEAMLAAFGRVEIFVHRTNESARLFVGVGSIGWSRIIRLSEITSVDETASRLRVNAMDLKEILVRYEGGKLQFGRSLSPRRRRYLTHALNYLARLAESGN